MQDPSQLQRLETAPLRQHKEIISILHSFAFGYLARRQHACLVTGLTSSLKRDECVRVIPMFAFLLLLVTNGPGGFAEYLRTSEDKKAREGDSSYDNIEKGP